MNNKLLNEAREANRRQDAAATDSLLDALIDGFDPDSMPEDLAARFFALVDSDIDDSDIDDESEEAVDRMMTAVLGEDAPIESQSPTLWQCIKHGGMDSQGISADVSAKLQSLTRSIVNPPQNWRELSHWLKESGVQLSEPVTKQVHRAAVRGWGLVAPKGQTQARSFEAARPDEHRASGQ